MKSQRRLPRISRERERERTSIPKEIRTDSNQRNSSRPFRHQSFSRDQTHPASGLYYNDDDSYCERELSLDEQMEEVNINRVESIKEFCLDGTDYYYLISKVDRDIFIHAVGVVAKDLNQFDVKKNKCAICGGSGRNFDNYPEILQGDLKGAYICLQLLVNKLMSGFQKLYPASKDLNDIRRTPISAINSALVSGVSTEGLQRLQADVLRTHQFIEQQQQSISSLNNNMFNLSNVVVSGLDLGSNLDTDSTGSLNLIKEFSQNFCNSKHK